MVVRLLAGLTDTFALDAREEQRKGAGGDGFSELQGDCNDRDGSVFPGAPELCNDLDDDCDGIQDKDTDSTWHLDGNGVGLAESAVSSCDDTDPWIYPGASERCNGIDDNSCARASACCVVGCSAPAHPAVLYTPS